MAAETPTDSFQGREANSSRMWWACAVPALSAVFRFYSLAADPPNWGQGARIMEEG